jgi:hypothetical protein
MATLQLRSFNGLLNYSIVHVDDPRPSDGLDHIVQSAQITATEAKLSLAELAIRYPWKAQEEAKRAQAEAAGRPRPKPKPAPQVTAVKTEPRPSAPQNRSGGNSGPILTVGEMDADALGESWANRPSDGIDPSPE